MIKEVEIWSDGSYNDKKNTGSWAYIINGENVIEASDASLINTGNGNVFCGPNKMELTAILMALKNLKGSTETPVNLYSDCRDAINGINNINTYEKRNWRIAGGGRIIVNADLLQEIAQFLKTTPYKINFKWIKGHAGIGLNPKVDKMATMARLAYEKRNSNVEIN